MLKITVQKLGDTSVLRCHGRIVAGDAGSILRNVVLSQRHTRVLVIDLARVERIDAGGLGVLLGLRELARSSAIMFKRMNATKRVEEILELTHLQHVFEFCSVRELLCLLHHAASMPSCSADQSDENDSRNGSVESYVKAANSPPKSTPSTKSGSPRLILRSYATFESIRSLYSGLSNRSNSLIQ